MDKPSGETAAQASDLPSIAFRSFTGRDYPLMLNWLKRSHVKQWWDDEDDTLEKVRESYSPNDGLRRYVLQLDQKDAGYFQYEVQARGVIGIDLFLADEESLDRGLGTRSLKAFVDMVVELEDCRRLRVDPDPRNGRAIRCFKKVGFRHVGTGPGWEGAPAYFMVLDPDA